MIIPDKCPKSWEKTVKQKMALFGKMDEVAMLIVLLKLKDQWTNTLQ